jgi:PQQ-dependent dehydrogenase (s-GDH family)
MKTSTHAAILLISVSCLGVVFAQDGPESVIRGTKQFRRSVLVSGLGGPWEITWGPDNMLWVTERTGKRVTRIDPASGKRSVAITIDEVSAPGGQDGLLGMALHPELLQGTGNDYVYVAYTYVDQNKGPVATIADPKSPYRFLYGKVVRLTYNKANGTLSNPVNLITGVPAGNDHVSGRLKIGPDRKLYFTVGDQGHNQLGNFCLPIEAQRLPTRQEVDSRNYAAYVGKSLRLNLDGSVPTDNPRLDGVVSHVFTYGHRNMQGIDFGPDGTLYASEQGPKTDDEVNVLKSGSNYGWPHVAGKKDGNAYEYAHWAESSTPCAQLTFSDLAIPASVPREPESAFTKPFAEPIATMFTVPSNYNFHSPVCKGVDFICWPTVGASSIEYYASKGTGIPGWDKVLLVTTLKRGSLYVLPLTADGQAAAGHMSRYFQSENRYRDTAISPDGRTIFIATDATGLAEARDGSSTSTMQDPGAILSFTYVSEGGPGSANEPQRTSGTNQSNGGAQASSNGTAAAGMPPQYTADQSAAGKASYNSTCAVCHGNTMTNGTFGPPLAGEHFSTVWSGKTVRALYDKVKTMPPAAPGSLDDETYSNIVAYVLEVNGVKAGGAKLTAGGEVLDKTTIK